MHFQALLPVLLLASTACSLPTGAELDRRAPGAGALTHEADKRHETTNEKRWFFSDWWRDSFTRNMRKVGYGEGDGTYKRDLTAAEKRWDFGVGPPKNLEKFTAHLTGIMRGAIDPVTTVSPDTTFVPEGPFTTDTPFVKRFFGRRPNMKTMTKSFMNGMRGSGPPIPSRPITGGNGRPLVKRLPPRMGPPASIISSLRASFRDKVRMKNDTGFPDWPDSAVEVEKRWDPLDWVKKFSYSFREGLDKRSYYGGGDWSWILRLPRLLAIPPDEQAPAPEPEYIPEPTSYAAGGTTTYKRSRRDTESTRITPTAKKVRLPPIAAERFTANMRPIRSGFDSSTEEPNDSDKKRRSADAAASEAVAEAVKNGPSDVANSIKRDATEPVGKRDAENFSSFIDLLRRGAIAGLDQRSSPKNEELTRRATNKFNWKWFLMRPPRPIHP